MTFEVGCGFDIPLHALFTQKDEGSGLKYGNGAGMFGVKVQESGMEAGPGMVASRFMRTLASAFVDTSTVLCRMALICSETCTVPHAKQCNVQDGQEKAARQPKALWQPQQQGACAPKPDSKGHS